MLKQKPKVFFGFSSSVASLIQARAFAHKNEQSFSICFYSILTWQVVVVVVSS